MSDERSERPWWQAAVIYQVYPRSFQDSIGDGVGDLRGIIERLDHLRWLGVDAIWLSPIFPSPMADFGYDIADYRRVDPIFGTLADLDELVIAAHSRSLRVLLDFVPNHTSDQHPWFIESRSSRSSPRRDWYIWRDPTADGGPPTAWQSAFGGSAWELDEHTAQYYFHSFLKEQPDLDWRNQQVRDAMHDVLRFWFSRGVDGFRIDVVNLIAKHRELLPLRPGARQVWGNEKTIHPLITGLRAVADEFEDRVLIGEIWLPLKRLVTYYGQDLRGLHLPFNFQLLDLPWDAGRIGAAVAKYEELLPAGAWPNWVLGNHDRPRIATRVGAEQSRVAAMLLLTLRGTPTMYYGDEIGMTNVVIPADRQLDPQGLRGGESRDPERTPMRWEAGDGAGFSTGVPWLPIGDDVASVNVAVQRGQSRSILELHRRLIELRRREPALSVGDWAEVAGPDEVVAFARSHDGRQLIVALNLGRRERVVELRKPAQGGLILLSTGLEREGEPVAERILLGPNEGLIIEPTPGGR